MDNVIAFIVARNNSKRLPGKALVDLNGKPVLEQIYLRVKASPLIKEIWFLTSNEPADDPIFELSKNLKITCFRGHPEDIVDRMYKASLRTNHELILEIGGDCPFIDPHLIKLGLTEFNRTKADFTSNAFFKPFTFPVGYDFILIKKKALEKLYNSAKLDSERKQPFQFIIRHPEMFKTANFFHSEYLNHWRWTLDYPEDLEFIRTVFERLQPIRSIFDFHMIVELVRKYPEINDINKKWNEPVAESTIWHTGSYISEMKNDIIKYLSLAINFDNNKEWNSAKKNYQVVANLIKELIERSTHFEINEKINND